jgi:LuxR family transcriptional regulator, maltose regulon positive regulatory protein
MLRQNGFSTRTDPRFAIPRAIPHEIERHDLLEQLTQTQSLKLVVLEASGGYGKTTLLAQWARRNTKSTVWLTLSGSDNDPRYFSESLAKAMQINLPDLELFHWQEAFEASYGAGRIAEALGEDLNTLSVNLDICLDNGDGLSQEACQWIVQLTHFLGDDHRIIFAHRGGAPIKVTRLVAAGTGVVIAQDHLVFSKQETERLLENAQTQQNVSRLHDHLEGWAAGLVMAGLHNANPNLSANDLIKDVLENLPADLQQVLPEAAVLEIWSEDAATLLGCNLPKDWLERVRQAGLPLSPLGNDQYRPHQLLIVILEKQLLKNPERYQELHGKAAWQAEAAKDGIVAARHYAKAKQFEDLNRLFVTLIPTWEARYEWGLVRQLLELASEIELMPEFQAVLGFAYLETGEIIKAHTIFESMITAGTATARTYQGLGILARRANKLETAHALIDQGLRLAKTPFERLRLNLEKAIIFFNLGQHVLAKQTLEPVIHVAQPTDFSGASLSMLGFWYNLLLTLKEDQHIGATLERTLDQVLKKGFSKAALGLVRSAFWYYEMNNATQKSCFLIEKLLPEWQRDDFLIGKYVLLHQRSYNAMSQHDFEAALQDCREALKLNRELGYTTQFNLDFYDFYTILIHLNRLDEVQELTRINHQELANYHKMYWQELCGRYEFSRGNLEQARKLFEPILAQNSLLISRLYLAEIARKQGWLTKELIQPLQEDVNQKGFILTLQTESVVLQKLYAECVRRGWLAEVFKPYLDEYKATKNQQHTLEVNTLGVLEVMLNNQPIEFPYAKVTELFVYLCLHGSATKEELAEMVWNESRPSNVYNAVKHLRQALALVLKDIKSEMLEPCVVLKQKRYVLSEHFKIVLDSQTLEKTDLDDAPRVLQAYRGDFLAGLETQWLQPLREHYKQRASSLAERYADSFKISEPEIALHWYKRAVSIDAENVNAIEAIERLAQKLGHHHDAQLSRTALEYLERGENPGVLLKSLAE